MIIDIIVLNVQKSVRKIVEKSYVKKACDKHCIIGTIFLTRKIKVTTAGGNYMNNSERQTL